LVGHDYCGLVRYDIRLALTDGAVPKDKLSVTRSRVFSPTTSDVRFDRAQEEKLAWDMVEFHRSVVRFRRRAPLFVLVGGGDFAEAITATLTDVARNHKVLPLDLQLRAKAWAATYRGHSEYEARQVLVGQCCPVSTAALAGAAL